MCSHDKNRFNALIKALEEITDTMFNAIKVNAFDVFESQLESRSDLIEAFLAEKQLVYPDGELEETVKARIRAVYALDVEINAELERYREEMGLDLKSVILEKNNLMKNRTKTNKYVKITDAFYQGNTFDKKK